MSHVFSGNEKKNFNLYGKVYYIFQFFSVLSKLVIENQLPKCILKKSCSTRHFPTISIVIRLKLYKLDLHPTSKRKLCTQQTVLIHQFKQDLTCTYETM